LICLGMLLLFLAFCYFWFFPWLDSVLFSENTNPIQ
jgi:hypothetical protein